MLALSLWSGRRDSNPRHPAWEAGTLPTELHPQSNSILGHNGHFVNRANCLIISVTQKGGNDDESQHTGVHGGIRARYLKSGRKEKGRILDEFTKVIGCHRKAAIRLLHPWRRLGGRRPFTTTRPGSLLEKSIPIRTFADWEEDRPGFLEVDLVPHCGESTEGFYLTTLSTVDVASGWTECVSVWGKGQQRVGTAIHRVRQRLPFSLLGDSDNGSEFISW